MLSFTPDEIAVQIGPISVYWYGILYAVGLAAVYVLITRLAARAGLNPDHVGNGMIIVAVAAVIGGRLYHVIDEWALYQDNPASIFLPFTTEGGFRWTGVAGLGVYGGIATGTLAGYLYTRRLKEPFWRWADVVAPGLFLMQAIGRWGNFFNQELYGPPTNLPWAIPIDCDHRLPQFSCATLGETATFHPLFLYESVSGFLGMLVLLWLGNRFRDRLRPGDLVLVFFIWYGAVRFGIETLRTDDVWTFFGFPTAQLISAVVVIGATAVLIYRHRRGAPVEERVERAPAPDEAEDDELADGAEAPPAPEVATFDAGEPSDDATAPEASDGGKARPGTDPGPSTAG